MHIKTVLIVDDSPTEVKSIQNALRGQPLSILIASNGEEALETVLQQRPDLVLLDVILPKKNGFQVCRQLKASPETKDTKVILLSCKGQDTDRFWGMKQGADDYIVKPFEIKTLLESIARHI